MLSQTAKTIKDVIVCSHFVPLEETVQQAMNHYTGKTFVHQVHLMKVVIKT